jgi:predicted transcriptional regulator
MVSMLQPLLSRKAVDLMSRSVVLVPREMSLRGAAHLLSRAGVSGAPVVDDRGCCIGVLSTTDFLHYTEEDEAPNRGKSESVYSWQIVDGQAARQACVEDYMNRNPVTVTASASVGDIARMMLDAHIHRVIVVDEMKHPVGVVSSTDILAAVAQASIGKGST